MANPQLTDYIRQQRERGISDADIKRALLASGWSESDIDEALFTNPVVTDAGTLPPVVPSGAPARRFSPKSMPLFVKALVAAILGWAIYFGIVLVAAKLVFSSEDGGVFSGISGLALGLVMAFAIRFGGSVLAVVVAAIFLKFLGVSKIIWIAAFSAAIIAWAQWNRAADSNLILLSFFIGSLSLSTWLTNSVRLTLKPRLAIGAAALLVALIAFPALGNYLGQKGLESYIEDELAMVEFQIYLPSDPPYEYREHRVTDWGDDAPPILSLDYQLDSTQIDIREFPTTEAFDPPSNCGPDQPGLGFENEEIVPCRSIGTTASGVEIFVPANPIIDYLAYAKIGTTIIVTDSYGARPPGTRGLSDSELLSLYDSFRAATREEVQRIYFEE